MLADTLLRWPSAVDEAKRLRSLSAAAPVPRRPVGSRLSGDLPVAPSRGREAGGGGSGQRSRPLPQGRRDHGEARGRVGKVCLYRQTDPLAPGRAELDRRLGEELDGKTGEARIGELYELLGNDGLGSWKRE